MISLQVQSARHNEPFYISIWKYLSNAEIEPNVIEVGLFHVLL